MLYPKGPTTAGRDIPAGMNLKATQPAQLNHTNDVRNMEGKIVGLRYTGVESLRSMNEGAVTGRRAPRN